MANTISSKSLDYWEKRAVQQEEALQKLLAGMTESQRIGFLAAMGSMR